MQFQKQMLFLGTTSSRMTRGELAGRDLYNVQLFDQESNSPVGTNVLAGDNNSDLVDSLSSMAFGTLCDCLFDLRPDSGKWKVRLLKLEALKSNF